MATALLLYNTTTAIGYPFAGIIKYLDAKTSGTTSTSTSSTATTSGGTDIPATVNGSGTDPIRWVTGRSPSGGWTLSGQVDVALYARQFATSTNAKIGIRLYKMTPGGALTEVGGSPWDDNVELSTSTTLMTWSFTPTSTAFAEDDRLVILVRYTNVGTMGAADATLVYGANTPGSNDSKVTLTETVSFKAEETAVAKPRITHRSQAVNRAGTY